MTSSRRRSGIGWRPAVPPGGRAGWGGRVPDGRRTGDGAARRALRGRGAGTAGTGGTGGHWGAWGCTGRGGGGVCGAGRAALRCREGFPVGSPRSSRGSRPCSRPRAASRGLRTRFVDASRPTLLLQARLKQRQNAAVAPGGSCRDSLRRHGQNRALCFQRLRTGRAEAGCGSEVLVGAAACACESSWC